MGELWHKLLCGYRVLAYTVSMLRRSLLEIENLRVRFTWKMTIARVCVCITTDLQIKMAANFDKYYNTVSTKTLILSADAKNFTVTKDGNQ